MWRVGGGVDCARRSVNLDLYSVVVTRCVGVRRGGGVRG